MMQFIHNHAHMLVVVAVAVVAAICMFISMAVVMRSFVKNKRFADWLDEAFSDENLKGSNQRLARYQAATISQFAWFIIVVYAEYQGQTALVQSLFTAEFLLITGMFVNNTVDNRLKKDPITSDPTGAK